VERQTSSLGSYDKECHFRALSIEVWPCGKVWLCHEEIGRWGSKGCGWNIANGGNGSTLRGVTLHGVRLKVGLRMLMVMRDWGVAFQAEQIWGSGQKRLEDGGVKGQRA
jgi:hypothetical protein